MRTKNRKDNDRNGRFIYSAIPHVSGIVPSKGHKAGLTKVIISGAGFTNATVVKFGSVLVSASNFTINNDSSITLLTPAGSGTVAVTVIGPSGISAVSSACEFTYVSFITPDGLPTGERQVSILVDETETMERERRLAEQHGHRKLARVNARDHHEEKPTVAPEGELQNSILQHPALDKQRFDGVDTNLNPEPPLNTEARREFDNEKREQDKEKQLRLGNMPKFSSAPRPQGG